ncbi:hypothetical protein JKP88DRAFT_24149, partial [Tribonema minus]
ATLALAVALLVLGGGDAAAKPTSVLGTSLVESLKAAGATPLRVVSCIGSQGTGKTTLMKSMFGPAVEQETLIADDGLVLLEAESSCSLASRAKAVRDAAAALAAADVAVYNVFMQDLQRSVDATLTELQMALEPFLAASAGQPEGGPKPLVFAVRDFDGEEASQEQVEAAMTEALQRMWQRAVRPGDFAKKSLEDVLDVSFSFLPSHSLAAGEYAHAAAALRTRLAEGAKSATAADVLKTLQAAPAQATGAPVESTSPAELAAALVAKTAAAQALATFKNRVSALSASLADGLDPEFGAHVDIIVDEALDQYSQGVAAAAAGGGGAAVIGKKRGELRAAMLREAHGLYAAQFRLLRAAAADKFRRSPATLRISPTLGKDMDAAMKESDSYMAESAKGLKSKYLPALLDAERRELGSDLRAVAAERLQLAKLQGMSAAKSRRPVGIALHWLLPEPFGTDASRSVLGAGDEPAFSSERLKADSLWFEFAPLDEVPGPEARDEAAPPQWAAIRDRAERMVFKRAASA